jgi:hypothetical protein
MARSAVILFLALIVSIAQAGPREQVMGVANSLVGLKEATGRNDGPIIEEILKSTGASKGDPWCAAFNYYCYLKAGYANLVPKSAWSPDWVKDATWKRGGGEYPKAADSFGIYFQSKGRVAHTGLIKSWGKTVQTIEGNTIRDGAIGDEREGGGVFLKRRSPRQIHSVRNWL